MATYINERENIEDELTKAEEKRSEEIINTVDSIISQLQLSLYGTTKKNDAESIVAQFNDIVQTQINGIVRHDGDDISSFITKLYETDKRGNMLNHADLESYLGSDDAEIINYLSDAYKNVMVKYEDLEQISNQLIELKEAILIMRDSIISANTTEGTVSREFIFDFDSDDEDVSTKDILENMEKKFGLHDKIKNHIVPKTLTYGNYYAYTLPYSKIFTDFARKTNDPNASSEYLHDVLQYRESTLKESMQDKDREDSIKFIKENAVDFANQFSEDEKQRMLLSAKYNVKSSSDINKVFIEKMEEEISEYLDNITICNDEVPIPFIEEGIEALNELSKHMKSNTVDLFSEVAFNGGFEADTAEKRKLERKLKKDFGNISDCYLKMVDPKHMIPIKIMKKTIGYYYIYEEGNIKSANTLMASTVYFNKYDQNGRQRTLVDSLVNRIVASFGKKFLNDNMNMKELIAESLLYFDLNNKRIKFQFIPAEYVTEFKINEDVDGNGVSMIEPSLFYAKLYLMLLLFKIASIVLFSNDTKVNYVRTSGVDKNISNKIQQIARDKQTHQINIYDMMSYTGLLKKIGNGTEMYIPVGRSGERGFETEILQGQDVQLNTELMEMLRNNYILGTGVPSAIMNYLNEADFAKSIETANTRFQGRVVSYQIDFNSGLTELYRKLAKFSGVLPQEKLDSFMVILTPPKFSNNMVKNDSLSTFVSIRDFILNIVLGEQWQNDPDKVVKAQKITKRLLKKYLPFIDVDEIDEWVREIDLEVMEDNLNPKNKGTDNLDMFADEI